MISFTNYNCKSDYRTNIQLFTSCNGLENVNGTIKTIITVLNLCTVNSLACRLVYNRPAWVQTRKTSKKLILEGKIVKLKPQLRVSKQIAMLSLAESRTRECTVIHPQYLTYLEQKQLNNKMTCDGEKCILLRCCYVYYPPTSECLFIGAATIQTMKHTGSRWRWRARGQT